MNSVFSSIVLTKEEFMGAIGNQPEQNTELLLKVFWVLLSERKEYDQDQSKVSSFVERLTKNNSKNNDNCQKFIEFLLF